MSRAKTPEETREDILDHIRAMAVFWSEVKTDTELEKLNGLAFSILTMIDGSTLDIPPLNIVPAPHPEDKDYHQKNDMNWYVEEVINSDCHLHDLYYTDEMKFKESE